MKTRTNPLGEYRLLQNERINASVNLDKKFPGLKSLMVSLDYFDSTLRRSGSMKYKANLETAKSLLYFNCRGGDCIGGDYDLSEELSRAIAGRSKSVTGEMHCQGMRHNREKKEKVPCQSHLRYVLHLAYL